MPLELHETRGNIVFVRASGRLTREDYRAFVARMERLIQRRGPLRMLFETDSFEGWDLGGALQELAFEFRHMHDLKRVAVVGEEPWVEWAARLSKLLTGSDIRYFVRARAEDARAWIESGA